MAASLPCSLGIHLYTTNGGSFTNVGVPPTWEKGNHLPPRTTKLCNLRNGCNSVTAPSVKPDLGFSSRHEGHCSDKLTNHVAHPGMPENVTEFHTLWGWHRYTRLQADSHHASNLSCPCYLLPMG